MSLIVGGGKSVVEVKRLRLLGYVVCLFLEGLLDRGESVGGWGPYIGEFLPSLEHLCMVSL